MPYTPTEFVDKPATTTPVTAAELNKLGEGIEGATTTAEAALLRALPSGGTAAQIPVKTGPGAGDVAWATNVAASTLVLRYTGGAYPAFPTSKPAGVMMVLLIGPEPTEANVPGGIPSWVGKGASQVPWGYDLIEGLL